MTYRAPVYTGPVPHDYDPEGYVPDTSSCPGMIEDGEVVPAVYPEGRVTYRDGWAWIATQAPMSEIPEGWEVIDGEG